MTEQIMRLWVAGQSTWNIAGRLNLPEAEIERMLHRELDAQHQSKVEAVRYHDEVRSPA